MNWGMKIRLIYAGFGISAGLMAGTVFGISYQNYLTTAIAYFSSLVATYLFYVHLAYHKCWMAEWGKAKLKLIYFINSVIYLLGISGMSVSLTLAIVWHQDLSPEGLKGNNLYMAAVWCWMTFKWAFAVAIYSQKYGQKIEISKHHKSICLV